MEYEVLGYYIPSEFLITIDKHVNNKHDVYFLLKEFIKELLKNQNKFNYADFSIFNEVDDKLIIEFIEKNKDMLKDTKLFDPKTLYDVIFDTHFFFKNLFRQYRKERRDVMLRCSCGISDDVESEYHSEDNHNYENWVAMKLLEIEF